MPTPDAVDNMMARLKQQGAEFDALEELWFAYDALPAVVDDDYPASRHVYEQKLETFLKTCKANGREV